jgi:tetratricopeptide (TPR) repeat protein
LIHAEGLDEGPTRERLIDWATRRGLPGAATERIADDLHSDGGSRRRAWVDLLEGLARRRPVLLWIDDAQWGAEAVELVHELTGCDSPVLALLAAQDEALALDAALLERMEALAADTLVLPPLERSDVAELIRRSLALDPGAAAQLEDRADGNPMLAVHLLADWVDCDLLRAGPMGFQLSSEPALPDDLHDIWSGRIDRVLGGLPPDARMDLERAAAVGTRVDPYAWTAICTTSEAERDKLVDRLVEARLAQRSSAGWAFAHGLVTESIARSAMDAGRWKEHHNALARHVQEPARLGLHLLEAGRPEEAIGPLIDAIKSVENRAGVSAAMGLLTRAERAIEAADLPDDDARVADVAIHRVRLLLNAGRLAEARRQGEAWMARGLHPRRADNLRMQVAQLRNLAGDHDGAVELAEHLFDSEVPRLAGHAYRLCADIALHHGRSNRSEGLLQSAIQHYEAAGCVGDVGACWQLLATAHQRTGQLEEADRLFRNALERFESVEDVFGQARSIYGFGEVALARGDLATAREALSDSLALYAKLGSLNTAATRCLIAAVEVLDGNWQAANRHLALIRQQIEGRAWRVLELHCDVCDLALAAVSEDWEAWDRLAARVREIQATRETYVSHIVKRAADLARAAGETRRAEEADAVARFLSSSHGRALGA